MSLDTDILPVTLAVTQGDVRTYWAPSWRYRGDEWQGFLGTGDALAAFSSDEALLAYVADTQKHDLSDHPRWGTFAASPVLQRIPTQDTYVDLVGMPALLAHKPTDAAVEQLRLCLAVAKSIGAVCGLERVGAFFSGNSQLGFVGRGPEQFDGPEGKALWTTIGHIVARGWDSVLDAIDEVIAEPQVNATTVEAFAIQVADARTSADTSTEAADPYDSTPWAAAGIDPIKVIIGGRTLLSLRCYLGDKPVFLGRFGEINTFSSPKTLVRWMIDNDDHDLASLATWPDLVQAANAGELEVSVHQTNTYVFTGLDQDLGDGPQAVDVQQLKQCFELLTDAARWSGDNLVNEKLSGGTQLATYVDFMLTPAEQRIPPSEPYTEAVTSWRELEAGLTNRFTKA